MNNENPLTILERREDAISTITRKVGTKGMLFIGIIGMTIIFASDLSIYATQGILIIIPFIIGAIVTQLVYSFLQREKEEITAISTLSQIVFCV